MHDVHVIFERRENGSLYFYASDDDPAESLRVAAEWQARQIAHGGSVEFGVLTIRLSDADIQRGIEAARPSCNPVVNAEVVS